MRQTRQTQLALVPAALKHDHARELARISGVLDELPEAVELVHGDLVRRQEKNVDPNQGRIGMSAEQVLRAAIVKQTIQCSYDRLAFHLADSNTYRSFCRIGFDQHPPQKSTLQKNIKKIAPETWEAINRLVVLSAFAKGIENGAKVRTDCTVVESNIHAPSDSTLLRDCVRSLVRLMRQIKNAFGFAFTNHLRNAKRKEMAILNAKSSEKRVPLYRKLLALTKKTVRDAERIAAKIDELQMKQQEADAAGARLTKSILHYVALTKRVIDQTERRVLHGESVPAQEKIVSIFEPHTDVIVKARRETLYGHKICLTTGKSGLVSDIVVETGNPADSTLAVKMIARQCALYGKPPQQSSFDGGFASRKNLAGVKQFGVNDVAFSKRVGMQITEMVKSAWVYRCLRNFRAGVEGIISFLKRAFGLDRCNWSGFESFKAYVCSSVLAANLVIVARHMLANSA